MQQSNSCIELQHCFAFSAGHAGSDFAYLKVETTAARIIRIDVMQADDMLRSSIAVGKSINTALTLSVALLILSVAFLFLERSRLLLVFCAFQLSVVFSICTSSGVFLQWGSAITTSQINVMFGLAQVLRTAMTILLAWAVLVTYKPSALYIKLALSSLAVCGFNAVLALTGYETEAATLNYGLCFLSPFVQFWGVRTVAEPMPGRWIFVTGWCLFQLFVVLGFPYSGQGPDWRDQYNLVQNGGDLRLNGIPIGIVVFWLVAIEKASKNRKKSEEIQAWKISAAESKVHQQSLKEGQDLIDMLTHELKTPLSTFKFAMATLKRMAMPQDPLSDRVHHINASVERMDAMIEHVALSNKIERQQDCGPLETLSALELMQVVLQEYGQPERFELVLHDGVSFRAAPHFLTLIIQNLVSNAVKYSIDGQIKIRIHDESDQMTCFHISNRVAADNHPDESRLFERYYRHPSFQNSPGMGIGLSLVRSAAKKMGAQVRYERTGQDVAFEVRFPR